MHTLSITLNDQLYHQLKQMVPTRGISKFISKAIEDMINKKASSLHKAYMEAYKDHARNKEATEWDITDIEGWD